MEIEMTPLPKTWILDLDGTLVKHNGYKLDGRDTLLPDARDILSQIEKDDMVIILTSRTADHAKATEDFLKSAGIRYDHIIYEAPCGERILINVRKPSGRDMAYAVNTDRDSSAALHILRNPAL